MFGPSIFFQENLSGKEFCEKMLSIWDGEDHLHYDLWHNANECLRRLGAKKLYSNLFHEKLAYTWQLPSGDKVISMVDGSGVKTVKPHKT